MPLITFFYKKARRDNNLFIPPWRDEAFQGTGNAKKRCDLALCQRLMPVQAITKTYDLLFPLLEHLPDQLHRPMTAQHGIDLFCHVFFAGDHIHVSQRIALTVDVNGIIHRNLGTLMLKTAKMHENLVLNTFCAIGCKFCAVIYAKGIHRLDQTDRTD